MYTWVAYTIAIVSAVAFIVLWFWVVRRELYTKKNMVEAAQLQLIASHKVYERDREGPNCATAKEILKRSKSIYRQAVNIYNKTLSKPYNAI
ncbi:MAG: hypothetical protein WBO70_03540, partial [Erysipelotrichaceae bacterium]